MPLDVGVVQLASFGDVIISSIVPHTIRQNHPDARITFYVSSACEGAIANNQDVDNVVVLQATKGQSWALMHETVEKAKKKHQHVIAPWPGYRPREEWVPKWQTGETPNFMWSYFRAAQEFQEKVTGKPFAMDRPFPIHLWLTPEEKCRAEGFVNMAGSHNLGSKFVMMETDGHSSQNYFDANWTNKILSGVMEHYKGDATVLISRGGVIPNEIREAMVRWPWKVHMLNEYSLREVSWIFNSCSVFIGGSSGTSNACHGHQCKRDVKWFEAVRDPVWCSAPLRGAPDKKIYLGANPDEFVKLIRDNL